MIKSILNNSIVALLCPVFFSCVKEPCLDIAKLDEYTALTKSWIVNENIGNTTFTDKNGINQTLVKQTSYYSSIDDFIEDDCGNIYGDFHYSIQYITSLSNIHFHIYIGGGDFEGDGFYLNLSYYNLNNVSKSTEYNFYAAKVMDKNAKIELLPKLNIGSREFNDVLEIDFVKTFSSNDVKTVYYSKGYGIIKFTQENGNSHEIN